MRRGIVVAGIVAVGLVGAASSAFADDDTDGGRCSYGDFSVNVNPSCDTGGQDDELVVPILRDLEPTL